jgi:membrane-bound ClpP family serine protease
MQLFKPDKSAKPIRLACYVGLFLVGLFLWERSHRTTETSPVADNMSLLSPRPVVYRSPNKVALVQDGEAKVKTDPGKTQAAGDSPNNEDETAPPEANAQLLEAVLVRIPLPIVGQVDEQVQAQIRRAIARFPEASGGERPILVLEFDISRGANGAKSQIGSCISLSRFLTSPELDRVRTVAYLPPTEKQFQSLDGDERQFNTLIGHAVLVALSCQQLVLTEGTSIGAAGIDESRIDELLIGAYRANSQRRRVLPEPLVLSLLDIQRSLYRVETDAGFLYVDAAELEKLESANKALSSETITEPGSFPQLTSEMLQEWGLIRYRVGSRKELAERLRIPTAVLQGDPSLDEEWLPVHIKLQGPIHKREIDWIISALNQQIGITKTNLILVEIDSPGGDPQQCLRLAQRLAEFDPQDVRTVAFVPREARGATPLIAMACDHLVMSKSATIGGGLSLNSEEEKRPRPRFERIEFNDLLPAIKDLAASKQQNWSLTAALIEPSLNLKQMRNRETRHFALFSNEELQARDDVQDWILLDDKVSLVDGLTGITAEKLGVTRQLSESMEELERFYNLTEPPKLLQPTLTDKWIQRFGQYLASPMIAGLLMFGAMFFFMAELSNPGIGVPGFISAILCMLFFWSQYCDGNANWLEILLFIVGVIFLGIEIFVVPGVGVFGIGGGLMIVVGIILASQDFIVPRTSEQLARLPVSLSMILFAGAGMIVSLVLIRTFLPHIPFLNRMILEPPGSEDDLESLSSRESLTHYEYLEGARGVALTPLLPSGKASFGEETHNVITDGRMIEKGDAVIVRRVDGNRIEVRPAD